MVHDERTDCGKQSTLQGPSSDRTDLAKRLSRGHALKKANNVSTSNGQSRLPVLNRLNGSEERTSRTMMEQGWPDPNLDPA